MLVTMNDVLSIAENKGVAIGSFNTPTLENVVAVIEAAEARKVPVIIMHAELHEPVAPLSVIGPVMVLLAERASVPVVVHLDHGEHTKRALTAAFPADFGKTEDYAKQRSRFSETSASFVN